MKRISVIIPALNEAEGIMPALARLQELRERGHELILVDGGSSDGTPECAAGLVDHLLQSARGRARQMNAGAKVATGDILLFLHADTWLPDDADRYLFACLGDGGGWGRFDVRLSGDHPFYRLIELGMNLRSRLTGIATGDQAMFMSRRLFDRVGGFKEMDLMEDIVMSRRLKRISRPVCLRQRAITSSRRWERNGILRTVFTMWYLRLAWFLGRDARRLAEKYD